MCKKTGFWTVVGIGIAASVGAVSRNIPAGLFIGAGTGMLLMIITNLEVDKHHRN